MTLMEVLKTGGVAGSILLAGVLGAQAGGHESGGMKQIGQVSGFEGEEAALGAAVADAVKNASPTGQESHDFAGREEMLGKAVEQTIKTLNHNLSYQHETNDALVKMTLSHIQFAKDNDMLEEVVIDDVKRTSPMMERVAKMIDKTGDTDMALRAMFKQTTCFFQLAETVEREPGQITYRSPFGNVLEHSMPGQFDMTEQEVFEIWTKPRYEQTAEILGVDLEISKWSDDGTITVKVVEPNS